MNSVLSFKPLYHNGFKRGKVITIPGRRRTGKEKKPFHRGGGAHESRKRGASGGHWRPGSLASWLAGRLKLQREGVSSAVGVGVGDAQGCSLFVYLYEDSQEEAAL